MIYLLKGNQAYKFDRKHLVIFCELMDTPYRALLDYINTYTSRRNHPEFLLINKGDYKAHPNKNIIGVKGA